MEENKEKKFKILITHPEIPEEAVNFLRSNADVTICTSVPPDINEILCKAQDVDGIVWATHDILNGKILDAIGPQLKAISTVSAGVDYVDVDEINKRKIPLGHVTNVLSDAVADLAMGLMIAAARRFVEGREKIECNAWENYHQQWMLGRDIHNSTVGFFGFGNIGQTIAKRLSGFGINRIIYRTRNRVDTEIEKNYNATYVSFDELCKESDFIFLAAPLTEETKDVFDRDAFSKMKSTTVFINCARGAIVKIDDLYDALKRKVIFAAGLDVVVPEPLPCNDKLLNLPNLVIIPHLGSATLRTRTDMAVLAANNVLLALNGKPMIAPVES